MIATAKTRRARPGWAAVGDRPTNGKAQASQHLASGWVVAHCGHPTANWPFYAKHASLADKACVVTHNGLGWRTLALAQEAIERVFAGEALVTRDRCVVGVARVVERGQS